MKSILFLLVLGVCASCKAQLNEHPLLTELRGKIISNAYPNIDGVLVKHHGELVIEEYFHSFERDSLHDTRSAFKSVTSLLMGIAIDRKLISLQDSLGQLFPSLENHLRKSITIQNLLEMRSGLDCEEFYDIGPECEYDMCESDDWIEYCLNVDVKHTPGLNWSYNSINPMLLGAVVAQASGMTVMAFAEQYLFQPLGITNYRWTLSPKGQGMTAGSFYMRPIDMLKIITMVDNGGLWNGSRVVSEEWIRKSTDCQIDLDFSFARYSRMKNAKYKSAKYGFMWYHEPLQYGTTKVEVLFASGNGGQYMMLLPEYDAQVVFTGSNFNNWKGKLPFEILLKYIIPMLQADAGK